ncbi:MAG: hypothetical protein WKF67_12640 [Rubrobacteraceae bacterium]
MKDREPHPTVPNHFSDTLDLAVGVAGYDEEYVREAIDDFERVRMILG